MKERERMELVRPVFEADPELLTVKEVAAIIRLPWKRCYSLLGEIAIELAPRTVRWRRRDVLAWLDSKQRSKAA